MGRGKAIRVLGCRQYSIYDIAMNVNPEQLRIVHYPDPILRKKAEAVPEVTENVREVALRMLELMHEAPGVGLAAPQVGLGWRMFVANATGEEEDDRVYINPRLIDPGEDVEPYDEGCLSLPNVQVKVIRPTEITIEATDLEGNPFQETSNELMARVWQHEYDHLNGVLIIDKMNQIDRLANKKALRALDPSY